MHRLSAVLMFAALALALPLSVAASSNDISKVNGSVRVEANQQAGDVSTVNGSVHIESGATVHEASTVNGAVDLGAKATATEITTVNGAVRLAAAARVNGDVTTVNGSVSLAPGADVSGELTNVNGTITLDNAHVRGGITTVNGDITIGANSRVEGGILIEKSHSWFSWFRSNSRTPLIVIGPHAIVQGTLEFRRDVVLKVSDSAQIGPVKGAAVIKFSGAKP
ncbi:MAG: hypothetical protein ABI114_04320 [Rhodanobacter sp.]